MAAVKAPVTHLNSDHSFMFQADLHVIKNKRNDGRENGLNYYTRKGFFKYFTYEGDRHRPLRRAEPTSHTFYRRWRNANLNYNIEALYWTEKSLDNRWLLSVDER